MLTNYDSHMSHWFCSPLSIFLLLVLFEPHRGEQLKVRWEFFLHVQFVREEDSTQATVCVYLQVEGFNILRLIGLLRKVCKVELYLIPPFIHLHGQGANKGFDTCAALKGRCSKPSLGVLAVQNLDFEGEKHVHVLDDHHQVGQADA